MQEKKVIHSGQFCLTTKHAICHHSAKNQKIFSFLFFSTVSLSLSARVGGAKEKWQRNNYSETCRFCSKGGKCVHSQKNTFGRNSCQKEETLLFFQRGSNSRGRGPGRDLTLFFVENKKKRGVSPFQHAN